LTLWFEEEGQIRGAALMWKMGGVGYLSQLLVDPVLRGRGLGRQLMDAFEQQCADCHKLALKTYKDSRSQRFYEALGFKVEAVLEMDVHGIDWVYMAKGWDGAK
jgi:GNAT superfamily N-acetyltransferase